MNRVIKFRAWDKEEKEMVPYIGGKYDVMYCLSTSMSGDSDKFEFMQFTGLTDKNGKEIYEGDIVRWINKHGVPIYEKAFVAWVHGGLAPCKTSEPATNDYIGVLGDHWEIIGNIYENPELTSEPK